MYRNMILKFCVYCHCHFMCESTRPMSLKLRLSPHVKPVAPLPSRKKRLRPPHLHISWAIVCALQQNPLKDKLNWARKSLWSMLHIKCQFWYKLPMLLFIILIFMVKYKKAISLIACNYDFVKENTSVFYIIHKTETLTRASWFDLLQVVIDNCERSSFGINNSGN